MIINLEDLKNKIINRISKMVQASYNTIFTMWECVIKMVVN